MFFVSFPTVLPLKFAHVWPPRTEGCVSAGDNAITLPRRKPGCQKAVGKRSVAQRKVCKPQMWQKKGTKFSRPLRQCFAKAQCHDRIAVRSFAYVRFELCVRDTCDSALTGSGGAVQRPRSAQSLTFCACRYDLLSRAHRGDRRSIPTFDVAVISRPEHLQNPHKRNTLCDEVPMPHLGSIAHAGNGRR